MTAKTFNGKTIIAIETAWWTVIVALFTDSTGEFIKWMALWTVYQILFLLTLIVIAKQGEK